MEDTNPMLMNDEPNQINNTRLPESPRLPMEFLSRSWSLPALQLSKALSLSLPYSVSKTGVSCNTPPILEEEQHSVAFSGDFDDQKRLVSGNSFSFASSATSQLVLERIMSQSEVSPMTSGRPSCSEPPNGIGGQSFSASSLTAEMFDSPTDSISPPVDFDKCLMSDHALLEWELRPCIVPKLFLNDKVGHVGLPKLLSKWNGELIFGSFRKNNLSSRAFWIRLPL